MNAPQPTDDGQEPARTVEDALRELRALLTQRRARQRASREARHLEQLAAQSARRRAPDPVQPEPKGTQ